MPISTDNTNVTIEFKWVSEYDPNFVLHVKHHHVNGLPVVSLSEDGQEWSDLPASLFTEVTQFLHAQKLSQPAPSSPRPPANIPSHPQPSVMPTGTPGQVAVALQDPGASQHSLGSKLPKPMIQRKVDEHGTVEPMPVSDVQPLQTFSGNGMDGLSVVRPPVRSVPVEETMSQEDLDAMRSRPVVRSTKEE